MSQDLAGDTPAAAKEDMHSRDGGGYAWMVVFLLMGAYVLSFVDRQILTLMVGPIRKDLGISDTQISLLMGIAFSLFYSLLGIPIARLADRRSRRGVIVVGIALWSLATASCGMAQRFVALFLSRIGVGVGEAALSPASFSLISDYFGPDKRGSAISLYSAGTTIGSGIALLAGGVLIHAARAIDLSFLGATRPWQVVFIMLGVISLLYCPVLLLVREPFRRASAITAGIGSGLRHVLATHWRTLTLHHLGFAVFVLAAYGSAAWIPVYFMRVYGWTPIHIGLVYGVIVMLFGSAGMIAGGWISDRLFRRGCIDAPMRVGRWAALASVPFTITLVAVPSAPVAVACLAIATFTFSMPTGLGPASLQGIVPAHARARVSAVFLLVVNLIGQGLGPTVVALVTDYVFGRDSAVGYALLCVNVIALLLAAILLTLARAPYRASHEHQHSADASTSA
jgi:MFS family permease